MSVLVEQPVLEFFLRTPGLVQALKSFAAKAEEAKESLIPIIGSTFAKYGLTDSFCLCLVHRHFDLSLGELLVETVSADGKKSVAMPWLINGT
jgi:hypothetical protein